MDEQTQTEVIQDEKVIPLRKPVVLGGVTYAELALREPTAGELSKATRAGGDNGVDVGISLISQIAKMPRGAVEQLCQRDFQEANDFLGSFTVGGLETGETLSPS
jgi:hypothetical protein